MASAADSADPATIVAAETTAVQADDHNGDEYSPKASLAELLGLSKQILDQSDAGSTQAAFSRQLPVAAKPLPGVRACNWEQFKNLFSADEPQYSIESLVGGPDLSLQVIDESIRRGAGKPTGAVLKELSSAMPRRSSPPQIYRIRIQSAAILDLLNTVSGDCWDVTKSHTFMRPFGYLIHHHEHVQRELAHLESQLASVETPAPEGDSGDAPIISAADTIEDIRAYVEFVESSLMPLYRQFDDSSDGAKTVRFDDLWYLFRPGELLYRPGDLGADPNELNVSEGTWRGRDLFSDSGRQKLWRVCSVQPHQHRVRDSLFYNDTTLKREGDAPEAEDGPGACVVSAYYLDFDGERVQPVWIKCGIAPFRGEREIRSLDFYPVRFVPDRDRLVSGLQAQGKKFLESIEQRHMKYNGWILLHEPDGSEAKDYIGEAFKYSDQYIGQVIVDVKEALDDNPHWRFVHHVSKPQEVRSLRTIEPYPVKRWADATRPDEGLASNYEIIVLNDDVDRFEFDRYLKKDRFIGATPDELDTLDLQPEDVALLPRRVYAYLFRFRSFRLIDVNNLSLIHADPDAFNRLQIDEVNKKTIRSVIHSHFERKALLRHQKYNHLTEIEEQDLIRGKGRGLVILIQGAPGVGKTATAEAVAQANRRPLIPLNLEDVDYTAELLQRVFRRAEMWDCIVLLDEADVYLSQRTVHDQKANLLVSFFLQLLENFSGLLFLTTNRPGALDEAVKSRVQVNLCYRPLDLGQTLEIFRLNMDRLALSESQRAAHAAEAARPASTGEISPPLVILEDQILAFAEQHYRKHTAHDGLGRWNGRQIRNAFMIASSLAHYEVAGRPRIQPQLRASHFEEVEALTLEYDRSRARTLGKSDARLAHERSERFDGYGRDVFEDRDRDRDHRRGGAAGEREPSPTPAEYAQMGNNRRLSPLPGSSASPSAGAGPNPKSNADGADRLAGGGGDRRMERRGRGGGTWRDF